MAETYRKAKVEGYLKRLEARKETLKAELEQQEFQEIRHYLLGQISSLELVIQEISSEFCLSLAENRSSDQGGD